MAEKPAVPISCPPAEHRSTLAWQRLGLERRDPIAVEIMRETRKSASYRLIGVGDGGGDVIAKCGTNEIIGIERTVYEQVLERLAIGKLRYYGSVTEGPDAAWIFLERAAGVRWDETIPEDCAHAGRWIAQLHVAAAAVVSSVPLPDLGPRTQLQRVRDIRSTIADSVANGAWSSPHRRVLDGVLAVLGRVETSWDRVEEICASAPVTLVHGDLRPKNTRVSEDKRDPYFRAFDWETAGIAAPAVDLARVDWRAYASVVGAAWPHVDVAAVQQLAVFGHVLRNLDALRWDVFGSLDTAWQDVRMVRLQLYTERIDAGLRELSRGKAEVSSPTPSPTAIPGTSVIEALEAAFAGTREKAIPELTFALGEATAQRPAHITRVKTFKRGVHRLELVVENEPRTLVAKRLGVIQARRNEHVFESWLPAEGLLSACPALLGRASERRGAFVWHIYEDIGERSLASDGIADSEIDAVVQLIARVHGRYAKHPMLAEARSMGGDLGFRFFETNIADALHGMSAARKLASSAANTALCDRLIARLEGWVASMPVRARAFEDHAGPDTLLHGDLWRTNAFVAGNGARPCLIDWDHAGAGPASYDMSTFLLRFPHDQRRRILDRYRAAMATEGASVAGAAELNVLFETAELSRYANRLGWLALALLEGDNDWAWEKVEGVEEWFDRLTPVIPECQPSARANGAPA